MLLRKATINDLASITAVEAACFTESEAATKTIFYERLSVYPNHFWLLEDGDKLVGFINGPVTNKPTLTDEMFKNSRFHDENGKWQMIFGVATIPEYRRQGCAAKIMRQVISDSKIDGRLGLVLTCKEELIHYYAGFGFIDEGLSESEHGSVIWHQMRLIF